MPATKEQISDLRSLHQRIVTCSIENERATNALKQAQSELESFLWALEHDIAVQP